MGVVEANAVSFVPHWLAEVPSTLCKQRAESAANGDVSEEAPSSVSWQSSPSCLP